MEIEDMWYRIERHGETLKGFYATFADGHTERWNELGDVVPNISIWGFQPNLSGPTAGEMAQQGNFRGTNDIFGQKRP